MTATILSKRSCFYFLLCFFMFFMTVRCHTSHAAGINIDVDTIQDLAAANWKSPESVINNIGRILGMGGTSQSLSSWDRILEQLGLKKEDLPVGVQGTDTATILSGIPSSFPESITHTGDAAYGGGSKGYSGRLRQRAGYGGGVKDSATTPVFDPDVLGKMQADFRKDPAKFYSNLYAAQMRWLNTQQATLEAVMDGQAKILDGMQKHMKFVTATLEKSNGETSLMAVTQYQNMLLMTLSAQLSDLATLMALNAKLDIADKQDEIVQALMSANEEMARETVAVKWEGGRS